MDAVISVIIPTLNEASRIGALLEALAREDTAHEVIVADGGSDDETVTIAGRLGASVLSTVRGRGQKLFAGAAKARGDVLLFLHADSVFPASGLARIRQCDSGADSSSWR
jgi:glycosyltransferase involved in cell wall biosynthesis